jgi:hypothetical protein
VRQSDFSIFGPVLQGDFSCSSFTLLISYSPDCCICVFVSESNIATNEPNITYYFRKHNSLIVQCKMIN